MNLVRMIAACEILRTYTTDGLFYAEHDEIFFPGPKQDQVRADDLKTLEELGVLWDDSHETWRAFV